MVDERYEDCDGCGERFVGEDAINGYLIDVGQDRLCHTCAKGRGLWFPSSTGCLHVYPHYGHRCLSMCGMARMDGDDKLLTPKEAIALRRSRYRMHWFCNSCLRLMEGTGLWSLGFDRSAD